MRYASAALAADAEAYAFKVYLTDAARIVTENTASVQGLYMVRRWADILTPRRERTAREIARDVMRGAGLRFKK